MQYHDYHLRGYTVADFGSTVTLDLVYDYPDQLKRYSEIRFSDIWLYHFTHTGPAIILDITPTPISRILSDYKTELTDWHRYQSVPGGGKTLEESEKKLQETGMVGWYIYSAIGFSGFVIAKEVKQMAELGGRANAG